MGLSLNIIFRGATFKGEEIIKPKKYILRLVPSRATSLELLIGRITIEEVASCMLLVRRQQMLIISFASWPEYSNIYVT